MFGGYFGLSELGAILIWIFSGFQVKYSKCRDNKYSFLVGLGFILFVVVLLGGRLF